MFQRLLNPCLLVALLLAMSLPRPALAGNGHDGFVGRVSVVVGQAVVERNGHQLPLQANALVQEGDLLLTREASHLYVRFNDDGFLSLRPLTRVSIVRYHVDPQKPAANDIRLVIHSGVARSITGRGGHANKRGFQMRTPLAIIGIRGTDFTVYSSDERSRVAVREGGIVIAPAALCAGVASGPCLKGASNLFASDLNRVLEVSQQAGNARLIKTVTPGLHPDVLAPAAPAEEAAAKGTPAGASLPAPAPAPVTAGPAGQPAALVVATEVARSRLEAVAASDLSALAQPTGPDAARWGRWKSVADVSDAEAIRALIGDLYLQGFNSRYALVRDPARPPQLPTQGVFGFALTGYEADFTQNGNVTPATLSQAGLTIDFARQRFAVGFTASGAPGQFTLRNSGEVSAAGLLQAQALVSPLQFDGALTGARGERLQSVFSANVAPGVQLQGGASWGVTGPAAGLPN